MCCLTLAFQTSGGSGPVHILCLMFVIDEIVGGGRGVVWGVWTCVSAVVFFVRASENGPAVSLEQ